MQRQRITHNAPPGPPLLAVVSKASRARVDRPSPATASTAVSSGRAKSVKSQRPTARTRTQKAQRTPRPQRPPRPQKTKKTKSKRQRPSSKGTAKAQAAPRPVVVPRPFQSARFLSSAVSKKGKRDANEDRELDQTMTVNGKRLRVYGVFDGHGGKQVANWLHDNIGAFFRMELAMSHREGRRPNWRRAVVQAELGLYETMSRKADDVGSTAVLLVHYDGMYWLVHVGDSRGIVFTKTGKILHATADHKPSTEREHVITAGGMLKRPGGEGPLRINGDLAVGRAFGDFALKLRDSSDPTSYSPTEGPLSVKPDVLAFRLPPLRQPQARQLAARQRRTETAVTAMVATGGSTAPPATAAMAHEDHRIYAVLACDGVWDVLKNEAVVRFLTQFDHPEQHCKDIVKRALEDKEQQDNVSAIVVRLR